MFNILLQLKAGPVAEVLLLITCSLSRLYFINVFFCTTVWRDNELLSFV